MLQQTLHGFGEGIPILIAQAQGAIGPGVTQRPRYKAITALVAAGHPLRHNPQALNLNKDELVQALGLSFTISTLALAGGLFMHDVFKPNQLSLSTVVIVPALLGMWLGQKVRVRISPRRFKQYLLLFLAVLGLQLIIRPFI